VALDARAQPAAAGIGRPRQLGEGLGAKPVRDVLAQLGLVGVE
jgi:hypothetical protein